MKIDIITCHTPQNYGAMLQAYALQTYIESQGPNVEIINYAPDIFFEELSLLYVGNERIKNNPILSLGYVLYKLPSRYLRKIRFNNFKKKYLHITKQRYESLERLYLNPPLADQYICGSDQIWNIKGIRGFNPAFYLGFVKDITKRNSYAASMPIDVPITDRVKGDIMGLINNLDKISVREFEVAELLEQYTSKSVVHVLDPVFLLYRNEWAELAGASKEIKGNYILVYPMGDRSKTIPNAVELSKKTGLPIYCISASNKKMPGIERHFMPSVCGFLQLIKNASYIITDSFHGTSFSIIFNKVFWSCQISNNNHRITSLLKMFHLSDRYIGENEVIDVSNNTIDYETVSQYVNISIDKSKDYLQCIISKS